MADRRPLIAGNWKMYKTCPEAVETIAALKELVDGVSAVDIMIAPAFTALSQSFKKESHAKTPASLTRYSIRRKTF